MEIGKWWKALQQILKRNKQGKRFEIAIPAYTPEEYEKIQEIQEIQGFYENTDHLKQTWREWRQGVDKAKIEFAMRGIESVEMLIDAKGLLKYCVENGMLVTPEARMHYAFWLYDKSKNGNKALQASQEIDKERSTPTQSTSSTADTLTRKPTKKYPSSKKAKTKMGKASKKKHKKK